MELVQSARGCASFAQLRIGGAQHGGREVDEVVVSEVLLDAAYGLAFALVGEGGSPAFPPAGRGTAGRILRRSG